MAATIKGAEFNQVKIQYYIEFVTPMHIGAWFPPTHYRSNNHYACFEVE